MAYTSLKDIQKKITPLAEALKLAVARDTSDDEESAKGQPQRKALLAYIDAVAKAAMGNIQHLTNNLKIYYNQAKTVFTRMEEVEKRLRTSPMFDPRDIDSLEKMAASLEQFVTRAKEACQEFVEAEQPYLVADWIVTLEKHPVKDVRPKGKACRLLGERIEATYKKLEVVSSRIGDYVTRAQKLTSSVEKLQTSNEKAAEVELKQITKAAEIAKVQLEKYRDAIGESEQYYEMYYKPIRAKKPQALRQPDVNQLKKLKSLLDSAKRQIEGAAKGFVSLDVADSLQRLKVLGGNKPTNAMAALKGKLLGLQSTFTAEREAWTREFPKMVKETHEFLRAVEHEVKANADEKKKRKSGSND